VFDLAVLQAVALSGSACLFPHVRRASQFIVVVLAVQSPFTGRVRLSTSTLQQPWNQLDEYCSIDRSSAGSLFSALRSVLATHISTQLLRTGLSCIYC